MYVRIYFIQIEIHDSKIYKKRNFAIVIAPLCEYKKSVQKNIRNTNSILSYNNNRNNRLLKKDRKWRN